MTLSVARETRSRGVWPILLSALLALQGLVAVSANAEPVNALEGDMCTNLAKEGKLDAEPELMAKYCAKTYYDWLTAARKLELRREKRDIKAVTDESASFYDLSAKTIEGKPIDFHTFEGYVTLVAFVPKACDEGTAAEKSMKILRDVRSKWPYVVDVAAFPFEHPDSHFHAIEDECSTDYYQLALKNGSGPSSIKTMAEIGIHTNKNSSLGLSPVYKYFGDVFQFETISATSPTVFLVSPDGDVLEAFYDGSLENVENSIKEHIKHEL
uniref:Thioredoxin domain-containing protein n=1 Tax=Odontella aurita TaxID=265563 RepID=A0A7S4JXH1_9STRA|mmetsp:Transcript_56278/g.168505  ORF Transcript_56278/g.168505 Transcript_56278/m.168505 type:complete len:269 (+) Transcript_56278:139-945(+)|eukprot:CAMPEP_0113553726 /NCGR_PEP_ID=MMETSP0015_2-20120614/15767_1 /TAXON_ID=2838 /ORGANISM="Odontella" /LENGTH=268 /DNA_ID=CAMNT_0000454815 /DNA_START=24 /DNA_END=830 /DNA_ORIENTATION=+ /assembly_acc=CAM_ASM_000160